MTDDGRLLEQWTRQKSQAAFSALVTRHLDFVYSVCLREMGDPTQADDVTQVVFLLLARKAPSLGPNTRLTGWLFLTARFACKNARRRDASRRRREQRVGEQMLSEAPGQDALWGQIAPHLNAALASLAAKDREAVLLRFADGLSFGELGTALGTSEDAARMRLNRALTRLRGFFAKQGVSVTAAALVTLLAARTVQAAPVACLISLGKLGTSAPSAPVSIQLQGVLKTMAFNKLAFGAAALLTAGFIVSVPFVTLAQTRPSANLPTAASSAGNETAKSVLDQSAKATAALQSLSADMEVLPPTSSQWIFSGTLTLRRSGPNNPNQGRYEIPGPHGRTVVASGTRSQTRPHDPRANYTENGPETDVTRDEIEIPGFSTYFFNPAHPGLPEGNFGSLTRTRLLGKKQWHDETYTAVRFYYGTLKEPVTLTEYFSSDFLLHGVALEGMDQGKSISLQYALKNLKTNPKFSDSEFVLKPS